MNPDDLAARSVQVAEGLAAWLADSGSLGPIAIFSALPGEPQLTSLPEILPAREFLYPLVHGDQSLTFHAVRAPDSLVPGHFGVLEPDPAKHPEVSPKAIGAFFCPGLAFSAEGTRLGRGGGFYDRALAAGRDDALRIGICFRSQIVPALPREAHDILMTHLADEGGLRTVRPTRESAT